jgi:hypothetical protein
MNITAVLGATVASFVAGAVWYLVFGNPWRQALGWTNNGTVYRPKAQELIAAFLGQFIMALVLEAGISQLPDVTTRGFVLGAVLIWLGFILPTLATNVIFQRRNPMLIVIDGLHWLLVLSVIAAVLSILR